MGRMSVVGLVVLAILGYGISLIDMGGVDATDEVAASLLLEFDAEDLTGYQSASGPREWDFPADFGPHPGFGTEWWYYTGNLDSEDGRHFGYQFTPLPPLHRASDARRRLRMAQRPGVHGALHG